MRGHDGFTQTPCSQVHPEGDISLGLSVKKHDFLCASTTPHNVVYLPADS